jgi:putative flippase GtrA
MILVSHIAVASAAVAPLAAEPLTAASGAFVFLIALASHYVLDLIPHWDYKLALIKDSPASQKNNYVMERKFVFSKKALFKDLSRHLIDGAAGLAIGYWLFFYFNNLPFALDKVFILGIAAGASILPDFIELLYAAFKRPFLAKIHKFHYFFHSLFYSRRLFENQPCKGMASQALSVLFLIIVLNILF